MFSEMVLEQGQTSMRVFTGFSMDTKIMVVFGKKSFSLCFVYVQRTAAANDYVQ